MALGWGERAFYLETPTWQQARAGTALKAASGLGGAALHAAFLADAPLAGEGRAALRVSPAEYQALARGIRAFFRLDGKGRVLPVAHAYGPGDAFYEAHGRYSVLTTCNTWANDRLRQAGLPAVAWTPFAPPLLRAWRAAQGEP